MKASAPIILLLSLATACAQARTAGDHEDSPRVSCIPSNQVAVRHIAGPSALNFEMLGGTNYRNELVGRCSAFKRLGDNAIVAVASSSDKDRLCAGDRVKIFDPVDVEASGLQGYASCQLGPFTAVPAR